MATTAGVDGQMTLEELALAARNHAMPLEALRYPITPVGLHYLLTHFDIPYVDAPAWRLTFDGRVRRPLSLSLEDLRARPAQTQAVTLECAGNGRSLLSPRPLSQPWVQEAVGTAEWTGTPLRPLLAEAGIEGDAVEVLFTGLDRGVQAEVEHDYQRSLTLEDASRDEVILAYAINGRPLPPQHGFPVRLIAPGWYGMAQVKWLKAVTVIDRPFVGFQQQERYRYRPSEDEPGEPVTLMRPRALMVPPGIPDFFSRKRFLDLGPCLLEGRAWSGSGPITGVEVGVDGGRSWNPAALDPAVGPFAWRRWSYRWDADRPGEYELCCRARDGSGSVQPLEAPWNVEGVGNNAVQRVSVQVRKV
jgi:DMSO/TMAO reductase YedYZ molybdopterin-dependent catalytic subunit